MSLAVQRNILLIPFKGIDAVDVVLYTVTLHIAGRCQASAVIDSKQYFFVIPVRRREYFLAGQLPEIRLHVQCKWFRYLCRVAAAVGDVTFDIDIDFPVFRLHIGYHGISFYFKYTVRRNVCYNKSLSIRSNICGFGYAAATMAL